MRSSCGAFAAFADDPEVGVSVFCVDMTHQGEPYNEGYLQISIDSFEATDKPFCVLSNLASAVSWDEAKVLRDRGIPVLEGTDSGLRALRHLLRDAAWRARPPAAAPAPVDDAVRERWRARLSDGTPMSELDGLALLADYGLPVVAARPVRTAAEAIDAADAIGYPVVLKTAAPGITHKSDVDGVRIGLPDADAVRDAYEDVAGRLGPEAVVAAMVPAGVEVALGVVVDPTFGPLVLVAAGGVLVEVLHDRASRARPARRGRGAAPDRRSADPPDPRRRARRAARRCRRSRRRGVATVGVGRRSRRPPRGARRESDDRVARWLRRGRRPRRAAADRPDRGHTGRMIVDPFAAYPGCVVLDGGLATELERRGADLRDPLWSARVLVEDPALIVEVHRAYVAAGADVVTGASYQASFEGLAARGFDREAASRLLARSVELAREAVDDRRVLVAASVGPYGAVLANGAEYTGDYELGAASTARAALRDFHLPRAEVLAAAGPDLLAIETIPSVVEAEALVEVLDALGDVPAWVSFSCRDGARCSDGTPTGGCRLDRDRRARRSSRSA